MSVLVRKSTKDLEEELRRETVKLERSTRRLLHWKIRKTPHSCEMILHWRVKKSRFVDDMEAWK